MKNMNPILNLRHAGGYKHLLMELTIMRHFIPNKPMKIFFHLQEKMLLQDTC